MLLIPTDPVSRRHNANRATPEVQHGGATSVLRNAAKISVQFPAGGSRAFYMAALSFQDVPDENFLRLLEAIRNFRHFPDVKNRCAHSLGRIVRKPRFVRPGLVRVP
jgi:hypothetical protein